MVTGFSLSYMLVNIDSIAKNEKAIAAKENFKVTYTQSLIFDCYGLVMNFKVRYINVFWTFIWFSRLKITSAMYQSIPYLIQI